MPRNFHNWYNTLFIFLSLQTVWSSRNNVIFSVSFNFPLYFNSSSCIPCNKNCRAEFTWLFKILPETTSAVLACISRNKIQERGDSRCLSGTSSMLFLSVFKCRRLYSRENRGWSVSITFPLMCAVFCSSKLPHVKCAFEHMHCLLLGFSAKHHIFCYIEKIALDY